MSEDARTEVDELLADEEEQARADAGSDTAHDLAEEASPVVEKPKGSPGLVTPAMLTKLYNTRAEFFERAALIDLGLLARVSGGEIDMSDVAATLPVMAAFTRSIDAAMQALECVARDRTAFKGWAKAANDEDRLALFFWYFQEMQPGEAQSSPSS